MASFISDVDECTLFRDICGNGVCRNREGSYECICQEGYELTRARDTCMGKVYDSKRNRHTNVQISIEICVPIEALLVCLFLFRYQRVYLGEGDLCRGSVQESGGRLQM